MLPQDKGNPYWCTNFSYLLYHENQKDTSTPPHFCGRGVIYFKNNGGYYIKWQITECMQNI